MDGPNVTASLHLTLVRNLWHPPFLTTTLCEPFHCFGLRGLTLSGPAVQRGGGGVEGGNRGRERERGSVTCAGGPFPLQICTTSTKNPPAFRQYTANPGCARARCQGPDLAAGHRRHPGRPDRLRTMYPLGRPREGPRHYPCPCRFLPSSSSFLSADDYPAYQARFPFGPLRTKSTAGPRLWCVLTQQLAHRPGWPRMSLRQADQCKVNLVFNSKAAFVLVGNGEGPVYISGSTTTTVPAKTANKAKNVAAPARSIKDQLVATFVEFNPSKPGRTGLLSDWETYELSLPIRKHRGEWLKCTRCHTGGRTRSCSVW